MEKIVEKSVSNDREFELDHIGIAVNSIEKRMSFYRSLGFDELKIEDVPTENVRVGFLKLQNSSSLELLEPMDSSSPIQKFLDKRGEGIHHICLRVKDINAILIRLKGQGVRLIHEKPRLGAKNCLVAFIHPSSTGGVLIELSQPPSK